MCKYYYYTFFFFHFYSYLILILIIFFLIKLPSFFQRRHCFELYTNDVVFEDNIRNIKTYGLRAYACYATLFKMYANFKFKDVNLRLLKMTEHLDESCIKVRWRVVGDQQFSMFIAFWSFPPGFPVWKTFGNPKPFSSSKESNQTYWLFDLNLTLEYLTNFFSNL